MTRGLKFIVYYINWGKPFISRKLFSSYNYKFKDARVGNTPHIAAQATSYPEDVHTVVFDLMRVRTVCVLCTYSIFLF
jgi:hypothetical protein